jgi:hypothetical protein
MFWQPIGPCYKLGICDYCGKFEHFVNDCRECETNICKSDEDLINSGNIIMQIIIIPLEQLQLKYSNVEELSYI